MYSYLLGSSDTRLFVVVHHENANFVVVLDKNAEYQQHWRLHFSDWIFELVVCDEFVFVCSNSGHVDTLRHNGKVVHHWDLDSDNGAFLSFAATSRLLYFSHVTNVIAAYS